MVQGSNQVDIMEWAVRNRRLRLDVLAHMREPMRACVNPAVCSVTLKMASQTAKTELLLSVGGYFAERGATVDYIVPTGDMAADVRRTRAYPSDGIVFAGVDQAADERGVAQVLIADEIDRFRALGRWRSRVADCIQASPEGRKILAVSTPTVKGESEVDKLYEQGSQEEFYSRCPHCGESHVLDLKNVKWEAGRPETAAYCAPCCGTVWTDAERGEAVLNGEWIASNPEALPEHRSFSANGLLSPFHTHESVAKEVEAAKGDPMAERTLINTLWGESYTDETANVSEDSVTGRIETFSLERIPEDVLAVTLGIDVQQNRLEGVFLGFQENGVTCILGHFVQEGSPFDPETWDALDELIDRPIYHPFSGGKKAMRLDAVAVDSGYATKSVVEWCAQRTNRYAIKGVPGEDKPVWQLSKGKKGHAAEAGESLHLIGTFQGKERLMLALQKPVGNPGSVRIGEGVLAFRDAKEFASQLTAEYRRTSPQKNGKIKIEWIRKAGRRSEILDCCVYADAAFRGVLKHRINWEGRRKSLTVRRPAPQQLQTPQAPQTPAQGTQWASFNAPATTGATTTNNGASGGYDANGWAKF